MELEDRLVRCFQCQRDMIFYLRISLPPQCVYRCENCKIEEWVPDRRPVPAIAPTPAPAAGPTAATTATEKTK